MHRIHISNLFQSCAQKCNSLVFTLFARIASVPFQKSEHVLRSPLKFKYNFNNFTKYAISLCVMCMCVCVWGGVCIYVILCLCWCWCGTGKTVQLLTLCSVFYHLILENAQNAAIFYVLVDKWDSFPTSSFLDNFSPSHPIKMMSRIKAILYERKSHPEKCCFFLFIFYLKPFRCKFCVEQPNQVFILPSHIIRNVIRIRPIIILSNLCNISNNSHLSRIYEIMKQNN